MQFDALAAHLGDVLARHGYRVTPKAAMEGRTGLIHTAALLLEGDKVLLVEGDVSGKPVAPEDIERLRDTVADVGADGGIYCHVGPLAAGGRPAAGDTILLWGHDRIVQVLGQSALETLAGVEPDPIPLYNASDGPVLAERVGDLLPKAFKDDLLSELPGYVQEAPFDVASLYQADAQPGDPTIPASDEAHEFHETDLGAPAETPSMDPLGSGLEALGDLGGLDMEALADANLAVGDADDTLGGLEEGPIEDEVAFDMETLATEAMDIDTDALSAAVGTLHPEAPAAERPRAVMELEDAVDEALGRTERPKAPAISWSGLGVESVSPAPSAEGPRMLPILLSPQEAASRHHDRLFGAAGHTLILQPVHLFDYAIDLLVEGSLRYKTEIGRVQVSAVDRSVRVVDAAAIDPEGQSLVSDISRFAPFVKNARIPEERAHDFAHAHLVETNTRVVEVQVPDDDRLWTSIEKRRVAPRGDQVRLTYLGLYLRPVWRIEGSNGTMDIDAMDGNAVDAALRHSNPDAVLLD